LSDELIELVVTCGSWQKANALIDDLFARRLIQSAEFIPSPASALVASIRGQLPDISVAVLASKANIKLIKASAKAHTTIAITHGSPVATVDVGSIS
jgi:hypothetical protein